MINSGSYNKVNISIAVKPLSNTKLINLNTKKYLLTTNQNEDFLSEVNKYLEQVKKYEFLFG